MASQETMIDIPRHGLWFVCTRAITDDDGKSKPMPLFLLLAMPYIAVLRGEQHRTKSTVKPSEDPVYLFVSAVFVAQYQVRWQLRFHLTLFSRHEKNNLT